MKRNILGLVVCCTMSLSARGQGQIDFDNIFNRGGPTATSGGRLWDTTPSGTVLTSAPTLHGMLLGGATPGALSVVSRWSGGDASAALLDKLDTPFPGLYLDDIGNAYIVPGVPSGGTAYFQAFFWQGNAPTYQVALMAGDPTAGTSVFSQTVGGGLLVPPTLTAMPSVVFMSNLAPAFVPEPGVFALAGLGALMACFFRRRGFPE